MLLFYTALRLLRLQALKTLILRLLPVKTQAQKHFSLLPLQAHHLHNSFYRLLYFLLFFLNCTLFYYEITESAIDFSLLGLYFISFFLYTPEKNKACSKTIKTFSNTLRIFILYLFLYAYTLQRLPAIINPHPTNTSPKIRNSLGSIDPSPVFGVSSSVWPAEAVPDDDPPDEALLTDPPPVLLPADVTVLLELPPFDVPPPVDPLLFDVLPPVDPPLFDEPALFLDPPDEPFDELLSFFEPPFDDPPRSMEVLPAPFPSDLSEPEPELEELPFTSTLVLPADEEDEEELSSSSSSSLEELPPPSRLENT